MYLEHASVVTGGCGADGGVQRSSGPSSPLPYGSHPASSENGEPSIISHPTEYLGPSEFTSVFLEHGDRFELATCATGPVEHGEHAVSFDLSSITQRNSEAGAQILQVGAQVRCNIPDEQDCQKLFSKHINPNDGWIRLAGCYSSDRIRASFLLALTWRSSDDLRGLAAILSENSRTPLKNE
ncbi:hypothetical protein BDW59DRAFT_38604 [Aspergillus cavernicola]|uniref:Uncharacterized protein n=1 Tax=Aspergillus cavernicola TaxID=176166 RepID=A0ABR4INE6_9EURO